MNPAPSMFINSNHKIKVKESVANLIKTKIGADFIHSTGFSTMGVCTGNCSLALSPLLKSNNPGAGLNAFNIPVIRTIRAMISHTGCSRKSKSINKSITATICMKNLILEDSVRTSS